ncbi:type II secretion system F family protein [Amycolatopsis cihanbeyliensis]|uniref:Type II secretion system (T2SS) protein F n=1 Tax=Amycolatopsis cihanbeyliensis TaxID=1128664 RepID=A0A542DN00_AMYCI|nr:type II secretion system F family protein [Amycolatopsis cihanbeyliensis]TQJ04468.1 type II secretion system (T2SS) protein F [Amycolatopsis cihanbeyliensis]
MTQYAIALVLLALACLLPGRETATARLARVLPAPATPNLPRSRYLRPAVFAVPPAVLVAVLGGWPFGAVAAIPAGAAVAYFLHRSDGDRARQVAGEEPARLAASWDLLSASLRAGLPVPTAVRAVAAGMPQRQATALIDTADLLVLGADPAEAWAPARACADTAEFARAACRTARSGTALAEVAEGLAARIRASLGDRAEARAQRVGVLVAAPLGLCFLPAFLCLGVVPVVVGLASRLSILA